MRAGTSIFSNFRQKIETMIDLTNVKLFEEFIIIESNGRYYDLHGVFVCRSIIYGFSERKLTLLFENPEATAGSSKVSLVFLDCRVSNFLIPLPSGQYFATLNIIYRGRYEENGGLKDYSDAGERYFYIDFEEGTKFEVFAKQVVFNEEP
jgi:hypothetical protein